MNHKHLLVLALFVLQSYSSIHADNWSAIFTALQGNTGENAMPQTAVRTLLGSLASTTEGKIAVDYVGSGGAVANSVNKKAFTDALATFKNGGAAVVTPPAGSTAATQLGDAVAANWAAAIAAFGSAQDVFDKKSTLTRTVPTTTPTAAANDAKVVVQYLTGVAMNATDAANLDAAFTAAKVNRGTATTDSAAAALKAQIEAAKLVYNQYKPGTYSPTA